MPIDWPLLVDAAGRPVATLALVALSGFIFFRATDQGAATLNALSGLVIYVFLPCLMVAKLCRESSLAVFEGWYWLPIAAVVYVGCGFAIGFLISLVFPAAERGLRPLFANMVAFQNAGYVPLPIVACLFPGNDRMLALVMLFVVGISPLLWLVSPAIVSGRFGRGFRITEVLTPPLSAILVALALLWAGLPGRLERIAVGESNLLTVVLAPFELGGQAAIPTILVVLGGMLAHLLKERPVHAASAHPFVRDWLFPSLLALARLVLVPAIGFAVLPRLGLPAAITVILLIETMTPTALALSVQVRAYGTEEQSALVGRGLLFTYVGSVITLPIWLGLYKLAIEPGLGPIQP